MAYADVFLGECATALAQNVDYEIPYLRKQATRMDQQIQDSDRKAAENVKNAAVCAAKYKEVGVAWSPRVAVCGRRMGSLPALKSRASQCALTCC